MKIEKVRLEDLDLDENIQLKKAIRAYADAKRVQRDLEFQHKVATRVTKSQQFRESVKKVKIDTTRLSNKPNKKR